MMDRYHYNKADFMLLAEQYIILALEDSTGKISTSVAGYLAYGVAGAILFDLYQKGKIKFAEKKVILIDSASTNIELLDFLLDDIKKSSVPRELVDLMSSAYYNYEKLRDLAFKLLKTQGIIGRNEAKKLRIFTNVTHPLLKPEVKQDLLKKK